MALDWNYLAYYGGNVAWCKGNMYRLTEIHKRKWVIEVGGNFFRQWEDVGEASSKREAEEMIELHAEENDQS